MAEPLDHVLSGAKARWMIGGDGGAGDHPLTQGQPAPEADLRLLAVAGQYQRFSQPPVPPVLNRRPDLPTLALPVLPDDLRPMARRLLQDKTDRAPIWLATFAAGRGHVLHPADWMPPPDADLPAVYRPWQLWQAGRAVHGPLTADTWLDYPRSERLAQVLTLRRSDPAAARALLAETLAPCPAEERLLLVEAMATGLTSEDAAFLQALGSDRSEKVRKAAAHLLARLGLIDTDPLAAEAATMFEVATEGLIRRRKVVRLIAKAKDGQVRSLTQTLPEITLQGLASALGLGAADFVDQWVPDSAAQPVHHALSTLIARTGSDADVAAWWEKLRAEPQGARAALPLLHPRLSQASQQEAALWLIAQSGLAACPEVLALLGVLTPAPISAALVAQRKALADLVRLSRDTTPEKAATARADAQRLTATVSVLGLLLTAGDAALALETLAIAGIHPADPMLDRLVFNAALKGS